MENITVRNAKEDDIPDVAKIQVYGWKTAYKGIISDEYLDNMNIEQKIEKRRKNFNGKGFIVACINDEVVGFSRYIDSNEESKDFSDIDCEIMALYVKPELKQNGIGSALFRYIVAEFKKENKKKMILWCLKDNYPSRKFYEKMGGIIFAQRDIEIGEKLYSEVAYVYNI